MINQQDAVGITQFSKKIDNTIPPKSKPSHLGIILAQLDDERTGMLALRASVIKGIDLGNGKINLIRFFEGYPTKTVILDVNALSKVMNKVESISELLEFFTNSPLEKIKTN